MNKKKIIIGFQSLILCLSVYSQGLSGKYINGRDFMNFKSNNIIEFSINSGGGITLDYQGVGSYNYTDGFLKVDLKRLSLQEPKRITTDSHENQSDYPDFATTQRFLNGEGSGLCIKVDRDTLYLRRRQYSYVDIDPSSNEQKQYYWIKYIKEK